MPRLFSVPYKMHSAAAPCDDDHFKCDYDPRHVFRPNTLTARLLLLTIILAGLIWTPAANADTERQQLIERVQAFLYERSHTLGNEVHIEVHPPSAHLPNCLSPQPFIPNERAPSAGRVSVGVRCGDQGQQVRYMQATIAVIGDYLVARQDIAPGTPLSAELFEHREAELGGLPRGAIIDIEQLVGRESVRTLRAGNAILPQQVREIPLVERGATVRIEAKGNGFMVSREGQALDSGGMGREVRVRLANRDILRAHVSGHNRLSVDF